MAKRLPNEKFAQYLPAGVTPDQVVAFETVSINTLPVNKRNIFENAVHSRQTLLDMAAYVSDPKNHVPVHNDHDQGYALPIGKTIFAKVIDDNTRNYSELRSIFYLDKSEEKLISKVESDTISEVSVGTRYKAINCSSCGWDYMGSDATDENIWNRECANEHRIGSNGVHLLLNGLDRWMEQSLVSLGAANGAKIVDRARALLGADTYNQLAASGINPGATTLFASATPLPPEKDPMDLKELVAQISTAAVEKAALETQLAAANAEIARLKPLEQKVAELTAANTALAPVEEITKQRDAALSALRKEADRLAIAAGEPIPKADATSLELTASLDANRQKAADKFLNRGAFRSNSEVTSPKANKSIYSQTK